MKREKKNHPFHKARTVDSNYLPFNSRKQTSINNRACSDKLKMVHVHCSPIKWMEAFFFSFFFFFSLWNQIDTERNDWLLWLLRAMRNEELWVRVNINDGCLCYGFAAACWKWEIKTDGMSSMNDRKCANAFNDFRFYLFLKKRLCVNDC